jgi:23S rRNA (adenine1618-N6)-methyltransferase
VDTQFLRGTGASCIYPLLGCRLYANWDFLATDSHAPSIEYAQANVCRNNFQDRIQVCHSQSFYILPTPFLKNGKTYDFVMCNPPFYDSEDDLAASRRIKTDDPFAVCTGAPHEMITPGGELAFVRQMIQESFALKDRIRWYTSLLGKKADYLCLLKELEDHHEEGLEVKGHVISKGQTMRWVLAWKFEHSHRRIKKARLDSLQGPSTKKTF